MDLEYSAAERAFRAEVRAFIKTALPDDLRRRAAQTQHLDREDYLAWQRILHAKGWGAPSWPVELGGTGWTPAQRHIFDEECAEAGAPPQLPFGLAMVGPVIATFGTAAQQARYLPRIVAGLDWWCQGYSEPGSGSDLASLKTRAETDGDDYVINGHKIWTTQAQFADLMFCLVRTDGAGKPQDGITFLLIDMTSPGITVRPIISIDGAHSLNEVFFDNVRVPRENRVGEEGRGWTYAKFLLGNERTSIAGVAASKKKLQRLKEIARAEFAGGRPLIENHAYRDRIAQAEIDLMALEFTNLRVLADEGTGKGPGPEASLLKILGTNLQQAINELAVEALGYYANPYEAAHDGDNRAPVGPAHAEGLMEAHLYFRAASIYGGSNEIQRNVIAKMVLGL